MNHTIEIVTFELKTKVDKASLLATSEAMNEFLQQQPGFIYRSLSNNDQNVWHDIIYWQNSESAHAGADAFQSSDIGKEMMPLIDADTCKVVYMPVVSETLACDLAK